MSDTSAFATERISANQIADALDKPHPTPEQRRVIESPLGPLLVVAGAGSGKTETMASRVVWLVANNLVRPEEILGLTFTRKAAGELNERIAVRLRALTQSGLVTRDENELEQLPTVSTYNAYASRIVSEHGLRLGIEPDTRMLSQAASWQFAADVVSHWDGDMRAMTSKAPSVTAAALSLAGELSEHLCTTEQMRAYCESAMLHLDSTPLAKRARGLGQEAKRVRETFEKRLQLLPVIDAYRAHKTARSSMDFADQVSFAARLSAQFPAVGALERQRYRMVLLDEFQDTSEAQITFLSSLFAAGDDRPGVTAVGDPHQSIFGWRGASASTLNKFATLFAEPDKTRTDIASLSTSWRNDEGILAAANVIADPLSATSAVPVARLRPKPGAGVGDVTIERYETSLQEASRVAEWIGNFRRNQPKTTAAVMCRKRSQFPLLIEALEAAGLPVEAVGLGGLLQTPEVVDLESLLWVVDDPGRGDHLMRLLTGPALYLGAADIDALGAWARELHARLSAGDQVETFESPDADASVAGDLPGAETAPRAPQPEGTQQQLERAERARERSEQDLANDTRDDMSLVEALSSLPPTGWRGRDGEFLSDEARERLTGFAGSLERLRVLTGLPLADFVSEAERVLGLDIEVLARPGRNPSTARIHLDAFADVAGTFSAQSERPTLGAFLQWLDAAKDEERGLDLPAIEINPDAVQVLTVHAAKGLEWDIVAVPGLNETVFPAVKGKLVDAEEEPVFEPHGIKGWLTDLSALPYDLRGDREDLAPLDLHGAEDTKDLEARIESYVQANRLKFEDDERRLAYVAFTRAKHSMLLTSCVWMEKSSTPRVASRYLTEMLEADVARRGPWALAPRATILDANNKLRYPPNPMSVNATQTVWPNDALADARAALEPGAQRVRALVDAGLGEPATAGAHMLHIDETPESRDLEVSLLLAERKRERSATRVVLPAHLSTSALVSLAQDQEAFSKALRRPMPSEPALAARRGTEFHAWIEQHYRAATLVDVTELPGFDDETATTDEQLDTLKANFLASEWAGRQPLAIEVNVETVIAGIAIRGRIDAVFTRADGGVTIVDWKTGRKPAQDVLDHRALQLAAYAIAYARLHDLDPRDVDAAFFYASSGETYRPPLPSAGQIETLLTQALSDGSDQLEGA